MRKKKVSRTVNPTHLYRNGACKAQNGNLVDRCHDLADQNENSVDRCHGLAAQNEKFS